MKIEKLLTKWAKESVEAHSTMDEQKNYLRKKVFRRKDLVKELANKALTILLNSIVYAARHAQINDIHQQCIDSSIQDPPNKSKRTVAVMSRVQGLLDSYFCGDKAIGDCTFAEVLEQAIRHRDIANGNMTKYRIFASIAKKGKGQQIVRKKVKEIDLQKIINKEETKRKSA